MTHETEITLDFGVLGKRSACVIFEHYPEEKRSHDYPGSPEYFEVKSLTVEGYDLTFLLDDEIERKVKAAIDSSDEI